MKQRDSILKRKIEELICKIDKQWGHKHLYKDFQILVDALNANPSLSMEELTSLDELIETLLFEAKQYSDRYSDYPYYPLWSIRCLECASELIEFLPTSYANREKRIKRSAELLSTFVTSSVLCVLIRTGYYKKQIENAEKNNFELLADMALNCFQISSDGRRPREVEEEMALFDTMKEGYKLANQYVAVSGDLSFFPKWFSFLSPNRTFELVEEATDYYERTHRRWYDKTIRYFEDTLDMELSLLWKWLDGDVEGFVNYWGAERIENLLELVEDDVFYDVLRKLASLKHNQTVSEILAFYTEDDEPQIKSYALKLLEEYRL